MSPQAPPAGAGLATGDYIDGRFKIERRLGQHGGESRVYLCQNQDVAEGAPDSYVVVKLYDQGLRPKKEVLHRIRSLAHPDLIRIIGTGIWSDRFFEVLEYCAGGSLAEQAPYTVDRLRSLLPQMIDGLDYCHPHVIHRDVKPTNFLFRDAARTDLVLTDFGISSYLDAALIDEGTEQKKTDTPTRYTMDYVAPELLEGEQVGPKNDYYGLGITLLHLILGRSPFSGQRQEAIISAHLRNRIPMPDNLEDRFGILIQGLTQFSPENRWGRTQIRQWMDNQEVRADDGQAWHPQAFAGTQKPFPYCEEATNPAELAKCLHKFDAAKYLANGRISGWVAFFDTDLADLIEPLREDVTKNSDLALRKLAYYLDQSAPLWID